MALQLSPLAKKAARTLPPSSPDWFWRGYTPPTLTSDLVIRSLRRRLWKALQEDDAETAFQVYTATLADFQLWLQQEQYQREVQDSQNNANGHHPSLPSLDSRPSLLRGRSSSNQLSTALSPKKSTRSRSAGSTPALHKSTSTTAPSTTTTTTTTRRRSTSSKLETAAVAATASPSTTTSGPPLRPKHSKRNSSPNIGTATASTNDLDFKGPILISHMNPSEPFIADDFLSPYDMRTYNQPPRKQLPDVAKYEREQLAKQMKRRSSRSPRLAIFHLFHKDTTTTNNNNNNDELETSFHLVDGASADLTARDGPSTIPTVVETDWNMTTPLHEAARLGNPNLIRMFLAHGGDPNVRNGMSRTALHMTSGGITKEEEQLLLTLSKRQLLRNKAELARNHKRETAAAAAAANENLLQQPQQQQQVTIGIRPRVIQTEVFTLLKKELKKSSNESKGTARKAAKAVGRMMMSAWGSPVTQKTMPLAQQQQQQQQQIVSLTREKKSKSPRKNPKRLNELVKQRTEAVETILSWLHSETGEGPSINAVDSDGRTALHYAAEMGRADACMAIVSNFGAMLTIIDELGARTPCELAGAQGHQDLAAQLEARAVLYIDPYGVDDELLENMQNMSNSRNDIINSNSNNNNNNNNNNLRRRLAPPYSWYETHLLKDVGSERKARLVSARSKLLKVIPSLEMNGSGTEKDDKAIQDIWSRSPFFRGYNNNKASDDDDNDNDNDSEEGDESDDITPAPAAAPVVEDTKPKGGLGGPIAALLASAEKIGLGSAVAQDSSKEDNGSEEKQTTDLLVDFNNMQESHVERFLLYHKWDVTEAIKAFKKDPKEAFAAANVPLPGRAMKSTGLEPDDRTCLICYNDEVEQENWIQMSSCVHGFCTDCLKDYLHDCAASKMPTVSITCPHHDCDVALGKSILEVLLKDDPDSAARIDEATNEQFVSSAHDFSFCTHPGCPGVVQRLNQPYLSKNGIDLDLVNYIGAVCTAVPHCTTIPLPTEASSLTYEGVVDARYSDCQSLEQPRKAHRFCGACGGSNHWPVPCERLEEWKKKMREQIGEVEGDTAGSSDKGENFTDLAQKLWLKANTRPCPQCNVPIEKNDGCNHMTCSNPACRYEFCWICRKDWKLHGTATGGFFRCNIWQEEGTNPGDEKAPTPTDPMDVANDQGYGTAIYSSREAYRDRQEMARFVHHYTRWEAHGESAALEQKMGDSVCTRLAPVVKAAIDFDGSPTFNFGGKGISFVHAAFTELLECRSVLKHSYAFSYFRYPTFFQYRRYGQVNSRRREKMTFQRLQSELEMITEQMSDIVARSHLRATLVQISYLTAGAAEKREEFSNLMFSILNEERKEIKAEEKAQKAAAMHAAEKTSKRSRATPNYVSFGSAVRRAMDETWSSSDEGESTRRAADIMSRSVQMDPLDRDDEPTTRMWECSLCTYMNTDGGHRCAMCGNSR